MPRIGTGEHLFHPGKEFFVPILFVEKFLGDFPGGIAVLAQLLEPPPLFLFADVKEELENQGSSLRKSALKGGDVVDYRSGKLLIQGKDRGKTDEPSVPAPIADEDTSPGGGPSPGAPKGRIIGISGKVRMIVAHFVSPGIERKNQFVHDGTFSCGLPPLEDEKHRYTEILYLPLQLSQTLGKIGKDLAIFFLGNFFRKIQLFQHFSPPPQSPAPDLSK